MTIQTIPIFYTVGDVNESNNLMNFKEPNVSAVELTATLNVGSRSMTNLMTEVERALNDAGDNEYTVSFDRDTRIVTIAADDDFDLLVTTGANAGFSVYSLIGFTADKTGTDTYDGDEAMGDTYSPQFKPQDFLNFDDNKENVQETLNESADGTEEVVTFGTKSFMEMNLKYITDRSRSKANPVANNSDAVQDIRDFLTFCITKSELEFMEDISNRALFDIIRLERTPASKNGTGFSLKEMINRDLEGYFETGRLRFRLIT